MKKRGHYDGNRVNKFILKQKGIEWVRKETHNPNLALNTEKNSMTCACTGYEGYCFAYDPKP